MMKLPFYLLALLFTCSNSSAQTINFDLADPQPNLLDAYGGSFATGDIDGDGDLDLLMAGLTPSRRTSLYLNDGNGNFTEVIDIPFPRASDCVTIFIDLDGDEDLDLFFSGAGLLEDFAQIFLNNGLGEFTQLENPSLVGFRGAGADVTDVDGDGDIDILMAESAEIYLNDGAANFTAKGSSDFISVELASVEFIDVENDGDQDVFISGKQDDDKALTRLYINDGSGNYTVDENTELIQLNANDIDVVDTDADGDLDVLMSGTTDDFEVKTILYINDGTGTFTELSISNIQNTFAGVNAFADLDNDGDKDLVTTGSQDGGIPNIYNIVYQNTGDNIFIPVDTLGGEYISASILADFNGDNLIDVIIAGFVDKTNVYWNNSTTTSLIEEKQNYLLSSYPNPNSGLFTLELDKYLSNYDVRIYTFDGRLVNEQLNLSGRKQVMEVDLETGMYLVKLSTADSNFTQVLLIHR